VRRWHGRGMRILVVEDDANIAHAIKRGLQDEGFTVDVALDGIHGLSLVTSQAYDVCVLDIMLPGIDGYELCARLRQAENWTPVLMLTAKDGELDEARALDTGADDFLSKPFSFVVLLARLRALLRRSSAEAPAGGAALAFADLSLDPGTREVSRGERRISLTRTEFTLLELFLRHPRQVLTRGRILEDVWGYDFPTSGNALEVYVGYLRRKTEAGGEPRLIHTVRGVGYALRETPP
jgi:two-component system, OmpR family, response regulator MprA